MKIKLKFIYMLGIFCSIIACQSADPCKNKDCANGDCVDGLCDCDPGYSKDANGKCTIDSCAGVDCVHGTCVNGVCDCDPGYDLDTNGKCTVLSCTGVDCVHGTCVNGVCDCDPGYELDANGKCTIVSRDKFIGGYSVSEDCSLTPPFVYTANIVPGSLITEVKIANFWNLFFNTVNGTIAGDTLNIPRQEPDGDHFFVEGTGIYSTNGNGIGIITFNYIVTEENSFPFQSDICTSSVYTKQ